MSAQGKTPTIRRHRGAPLLFVIGAGLLWLLGPANAEAARYWVRAAGSAGNWNDTANWSATSGGAGSAGVPGSADIAYFDNLGLGDCNIDTAGGVVVLGINIGSGYSGIISQNAGISLTVRTSGFTQAGGTFNVNANTLTLGPSGYNSFFSLTGGTFDAGSGTIAANTNVTPFWSVTGGVFTAGASTVTFSRTMTITGSHTLNAVTFLDSFGGATYGGGQDTKTIASGTVLTVNGTLTLDSAGGNVPGLNGPGTIKPQGAVVLLNGGHYGTAVLVFDNTAVQSITAPAGAAAWIPGLTLNKASGGTLTLVNNLNVNGNWTMTTPAALVPVTNTITFSGNLTITGSHTLNTVTFSDWYGAATYGGGLDTKTIASGTVLTVNGTLTLDSAGGNVPVLNGPGTIKPQGEVVLLNGGHLGTAILVFDNTAAQTITAPAGAAAWIPGLTLNKASGGTLTLVNNLNVNGNWTITTAAALAPVTNTITFAGSRTITGSHTLNTVTFTDSFGAATYGGGFDTKTIASGTVLTVNGTLTLDDPGGNRALLNGPGAIAAKDGFVVTGIGLGGTVGFTFSGAGDQIFPVLPTGAAMPTGNITVTKPAGTKLILASNLSLGTTSLIVNTGSTLDLAEHTLASTSGTLTNNGTILASGGGTPITSNFSLGGSGTVIYTGNAADAPVTVKNGSYGTLTLDNPGTVFTLSGATTAPSSLAGTLTVTAGSTLDVSASNHALGVYGAWVNNGTFVPRAGTVTLGTTPQTLSGTTTFYNLTKTIGSTLILPAGLTTTVQNSLTLQGTRVGEKLALRSSSDGVPAKLTLNAGGTQSLYFLDVKDNDASAGQQLIAYDSTNAGNNTNWAFQAIDLTSGLVGYWKLDNDAADAAGTNTGTVSGATFVTTPAPTSYANTHALSLNGASGYVDVPNAAPLNLSGNFTVAFWLRLAGNADANWRQILVKGNGTSRTPGIWLASTGTCSSSRPYVQLDASGGADQGLGCNAWPMGLNTWYHVAVTLSGSAYTYYVNGASPVSATISGTPTTNAASLRFGTSPNFPLPINGLLDDVRLYNRALNATEVKRLATNGAGSFVLKDPVTNSTTLTNALNVNAVFSNVEIRSDGSASTCLQNLSPNGAIVCSTQASGVANFTWPTLWTLNTGDGIKTVQGRIYLDASTFYTVTSSITFDATPPAAPTGLTLTASADGTSLTGVVTAPSDADVTQLIWRYTATDGVTTSPTYPASVTDGTALGSGLSTVTPGAGATITASALTPLKTYAVAVWAKDRAGNVSSAAATKYLYLTPPTPRLVISAPSNALSAVAGQALTLTITAKDSSGTAITNYAGPYTLTWTPAGGTATTLVSSGTSFTSGATSTSVTIGGSSAGPGSFSASDGSSNALTTGTLAFTFYPASFTVTPSATGLTTAEPFTLTVTAKDSAGSTVTRYSGTANLSVSYVNPFSGTKGLSLLLIGPANFASGTATVTLHYPDAGQIQIRARDTSYVTGMTIEGTTPNLTVRPKTFSVTLVGLPPNLARPYVNFPFRVEVKALGADGAVTPNYAGTITVNGAEGLSTNTVTKTFVPNVEHGVALVQGLQSALPGTGVIQAVEGPVSGKTATFSIRKATLVLNSVTGQPGTLTISAYIRDDATNLPVNEDNSTRFTLSLANDTGGSSAVLGVTGMPGVASGTVSFPITKSTEGSVTVNATVYGFAMPVQPALVTWSNSAGTSSTTTFQVLQFEQAPSTTTMYQPPSGSYTPPPGAFAPPDSTSSLSGYNTTTFIAPPSFLTPASFTGTFTPPENAGTFTMGGTRYDASVTMGYTLVAPTMPGSFRGQDIAMRDMARQHPVPEFAPVMFGPSYGAMSAGPRLGPPPTALRSKMEALAQSWKDTGKLNTKQFDVVMEGIQTGQKPAGADTAFAPEAGRAMHQEFEAMMPNSNSGDTYLNAGYMSPEFGTPDGMPPAWLAGPGTGDALAGPQMDPFMVFDPSSQGWQREGLGGFEGFFGEGDGPGDDDEDEERSESLDEPDPLL